MNSFTVNGEPRHLREEVDTTLIDVLREDLRLTGTKLVCGAARAPFCLTASRS